MDIASNKDDKILMKRLTELSDISYNRSIPMFSDFMTLHEQSLFHSLNFSKDVSFLYGGFDLAERKIAVFLPYPDTDKDLTQLCPLSIIEITPVNKNYFSSLTHRDFLGTILGLGIERSQIGDILINEESAYILCKSNMADYIINSISKIKNTSVLVRECYELGDISLKYKEISGSVSSIRLDCILALAFSASRSKLISFIESGQVYVNGRIITSNAYNLKENDIVSVRHMGKFKYIGTSNLTKKGKFIVTIYKYT